MPTEFIITIGQRDHPFSTDEQNIAERIAYYQLKAKVMKSPMTGLRYKVGEAWIPFDYTRIIDDINKIHMRLMDIVSKNWDELEDMEQANDDPLAFHKECHNCGKPTKFYNDSCNRHCDDLVYENTYECRRGEDCIQCKYIIK
jgi:hypothetical protein